MGLCNFQFQHLGVFVIIFTGFVLILLEILEKHWNLILDFKGT